MHFMLRIEPWHINSAMLLLSRKGKKTQAGGGNPSAPPLPYVTLVAMTKVHICEYSGTSDNGLPL